MREILPYLAVAAGVLWGLNKMFSGDDLKNYRKALAVTVLVMLWVLTVCMAANLLAAAYHTWLG
ncbi:MAG: hypothetical protein IJ228_01695 [Succinivibrio sp.]|nr:hypothetical protein [Succinivibrio sp.]